MKPNETMPRDSHAVDAAIITALPKELHAVLRSLPGFQTVKVDSQRTFYRATTPRGCSLLLTCMSSMGATESAILASEVLRHFNPGRVILTGIAGALSDDVALGDIVVSEQVVDYELAKVRDKEIERRWSVYRNDPVFLDRAKQYHDTSWHNLIAAPLPSSAPVAFRPQVHFGVIMSGNKIIANKAVAADFVTVWRRALAVEMEGAGIGAVLHRHEPSIPFITIKGICDRADSHKDDTWQEYAAASAAAYTISMMTSLFGPSDMPMEGRPEDDSTIPGTRIPKRSLRILVADHYSLGELKVLAFDIDVDWDEVPGETKSERIVHLLQYCQRKRKLDGLLKAIDRDTQGGITKYAEPPKA